SIPCLPQEWQRESASANPIPVGRAALSYGGSSRIASGTSPRPNRLNRPSVAAMRGSDLRCS
ncbi:hypothetical protein, partial [Streptomyces sp. NPDC090080]|uniref:hypothetical protein n=1 Tax=Streptomyces sp. NPDC090080 TaxID=3365939 RepID=UPI00380D8C23